MFTDGAGYQDGYGGSASLVTSAKHGKYFHRISAYTGTSTDRTEFMALIHGLQSIMEEMKWTDKLRLRSMELIPIQVLWYSDRESLVKSVNREYGRKAQPDLWAWFDWFERHFKVFGVHVKRETNHLQNLTDRLASEARILIKDYDLLAQEQQHI